MSRISLLHIKKRIIVLFFIVFLVFAGLGLRLLWIQVVNSDFYQSKALDQRLRQLKVEAKRGIVYDRNGEKLAVSASAQTLVAIPLEIKDPKTTAHKLDSILEQNYDFIYDRLTRTASAVYVSRKLEEDTVEAIQKLNMDGLIFTEESKRYYPGENLACHLLGFAGIDSQGLDGLELSYDENLTGIPGMIKVERDAAGRSIPDGVQQYVSPQNGNNIYLTLDSVIQYIAERELEKAMEDFNVSGGTIIVMDPSEGDILALANRPDYNPNNFADYKQEYWRNIAISNTYEPGSTFKIITTASALEEGVVNENDIFVDPGHIKVSGERINCWKAGGHGRQTFSEVVQNSCNPGFVQVGMRLGKDSFYDYIKAFGFGERTGIQLPGETNGILLDYDNIGPVELATISFGQGIAVTPIQLTAAVSAVANGGVLFQPRLVDEIRDSENNLITKIEPKSIRRVISQGTAERTLKLLESVVSEGTGGNAAVEGYRIGGKTGTAKHYGEEIYDSSFIGIAPVDDPAMVILVVLYDVTGTTYYGSQTAAPVFKNVLQDVFRYLEIPPQKQEKEDRVEEEKIKIPEVENLDILQAENILRNIGLDVKLIGEGRKVLEQTPLAGANVLPGSTVLLITEESSSTGYKYYVAVPDLKGLTGSDAANLLAALGLNIIIKGEGLVVEQNLEAGERVPGGTKITVELLDE